MVRITKRPDMTSAVYRGHKSDSEAINPQTNEFDIPDRSTDCFKPPTQRRGKNTGLIRALIRLRSG